MSDLLPIRIHSINQVSINTYQTFFFSFSPIQEPILIKTLYRIESLASRTGAKIIYRPVLLGAIYRATSAPQGAAGSASDVFNPTKKAVSSRAFQRTIKRHGLAYHEPPQHPMKTTAALRLLYFIEESDRPKLTAALFRAYWAEGKNISAKETLIHAVKSSNLSNEEEVLRAIEDGSFEGVSQRRQLESATNDAVERGSPGVPGFYLPEETYTEKSTGTVKKGRLYWGQDRMPFVESVLHALNSNLPDTSSTSLSRIPHPLLSLIPRTTRSSIPAGQEVHLQFFYDFSSPWAFLGWTQLPRLLRQFGSNLTIELKPFLLGILFREIGAPNTPSTAISKQKREYMSKDHGDWVRFWNAVNAQTGGKDKEIEFYWADNFPIRTPSLLRVAMVEPATVSVLCESHCTHPPQHRRRAY